MNCWAGKPKTEGVNWTEGKQEKRSEVKKNPYRLGALEEVWDSSSPGYKIALGWAETVCEEEGRKRGFEIHSFPCSLAKKRVYSPKINYAFPTLESHGPEVHMPFLQPQHPSLMEKVKFISSHKNCPSSLSLKESNFIDRRWKMKSH